MNTQNKNSYRQEGNKRYEHYAQKEGDEFSCVKILEGKFKGVIYHYGKVSFTESEELKDGKLLPEV